MGACHSKASGISRGNASSGEKENNNISSIEKDSIFEYTTSKYEQINYALRNGKSLGSKNESIVKNLDSAIEKSKLASGTKLYRGTSPEALGIDKDIKKMSAEDVKALIGKTISDNAYTSTSTEEKSASIFAGRGEKRGNVKIVYTTKGKKKGLTVGGNSNFGERENEVILPRNAKCKIVNAKRMLNTLTVYVEY